MSYNHSSFDFHLLCNDEQNPITFHSNIQGNLISSVALSQDKWIQLNQTYIELCAISTNEAQCDELYVNNSIPDLSISRLKLISFEQNSTGAAQIELFIISQNNLYFGFFKKGSDVKA